MNQVPLFTGEQIRRLSYFEKGGWTLTQMEEAFAEMRQRVGQDNPLFDALVRTFEACVSELTLYLSNVDDFSENICRETHEIRSEYAELQKFVNGSLVATLSVRDSRRIKSLLGRLEFKLFRMGRLAAITTNPVKERRIVDDTLMAALRFMSLSIAAEWPRSSGRKEARSKGDSKTKWDYARPIYALHPQRKVLWIYFEAEKAFHEARPGEKYLSITTFEEGFKKKVRQWRPTA